MSGLLNKVIISSSNTREDVSLVALEALSQTLLLLKGWGIPKEKSKEMLYIIKNLELQVKGAAI